MEKPVPAHSAGMDEYAGVRLETLDGESRAPDFVWIRRINGHVNDQRRSNDIRARHKAPEPAVSRIVPVIAHHEIFAGRHHDLAVHHMVREILLPFGGNAAAKRIDAV